MRDALAANRPDWTSFPAELDQAWDWMDQQGYSRSSPDGYFVAPYAGNRVLGPTFDTGRTLQGWFEPGTPAYSKLLPLGDAAGDGALLAMWDDGGEMRFVVLDDGAGFIVAENVSDFLALLSIGYDEFFSFTIAGPPENQDAVAGLAGFREWVSTLGVAVPAEWPEVGDDRFTDWVRAQLG